MGGHRTRRIHPNGEPQQIRGQMSLVAPITTVCTLADTYYMITGVAAWEEATAGANCCFALTDTGTLTYTGPSGAFLRFGGTSDLDVDSAVAHTITYALYIDGVLAPKAQTPHDFNALNKTENISIVNFAHLTAGQTMEIYVKSSLAGVTVTHKTLSIALTGSDL